MTRKEPEVNGRIITQLITVLAPTMENAHPWETEVGIGKLTEAAAMLDRLPRFTGHEDPKKTRPYLLRYFEYAHLPERLQAPSKAVAEVVDLVAWTYASESPEYHQHNLVTTSAVRLMLEAKDCFVRALLPQ